MKVSVLQENLKTGLNALGKALTSNRLPLVRLSADGDQFTLTASRGDVDIHFVCPASIDETGSAVVDGKALLSQVRTLPNIRVDIQADDKSLSLIQWNKTITLRTVPADHLPAVPTLPDAPTAVISSAAQFRAAAEHALTTDGELATLRLADSRLVVQASDGFRLHRADIAADGPDSVWPVAASALKALAANLPKKHVPLRLYVLGTRLAIAWDRYIAVLALSVTTPSDRHFDRPVFRAAFDVSALTAALKRAKVVNASVAELRTAPDGSELEIYSEDVEIGDCLSPLPSADAVLPSEWQVYVDPSLLLDALDKLGTTRVIVRFHFAHIGPLWVEPIEADDVPRAALVMPRGEKPYGRSRITEHDIDLYYREVRAELNAYEDSRADLALRVAIRDRQRRNDAFARYGQGWRINPEYVENWYGL